MFPPITVIIVDIAITSAKYCRTFIVTVLLSCSHAKSTAEANIAIGIKYCIQPINFSSSGIMFCPIYPGFPYIKNPNTILIINSNITCISKLFCCFFSFFFP